ncbi:spore germination protein [Paenibacillus sp. WQ 127069]|uniref:Spore germination protein n=1 Tax=Paenibacillus baimaensis TaxID=2982185 RepID=A0ABT2UK20_9BACL|nr:spore germination protein [Paenibacillus sp. WQ 127069]MCU6794985.1 spore germination protein [Paenibacillus sp. WQ 127069]
MRLVEKISLSQLFVLIFSFHLGTTIVVSVANQAKQDAWIAILLASFIGIGLIQFYSFILMKMPNKNLFEILEACFGRKIAILVSLGYIEYFIYNASRNLRDFCELIKIVIFPNTPMEFISLTFMLVIAYILYMGIEVLGRSMEIFFPYTVFFLILIMFLLYIGGNIHLENLQPILAEGFKPILKAIFPVLLTFPNGELIVLTIIGAYVTQCKHIKKISIISVTLAGLLLTGFTMIKISVLGFEINERSTFPLLNAAREISVANFIERLDAVVVFVMMMGIYVKVSIFFYCALRGIGYVSKLHYRPFVIPVAMQIALFAILIAANTTEHFQEGFQLVPLYIHLPIQYIIPFLIFLFIICKNIKKGGAAKDVV